MPTACRQGQDAISFRSEDYARTRRLEPMAKYVRDCSRTAERRYAVEFKYLERLVHSRTTLLSMIYVA